MEQEAVSLSYQSVWWVDLLKYALAAFFGALFALLSNIGINWLKERKGRRASLVRVLFCLKNQLAYLEWIRDNINLVENNFSSVSMDIQTIAKVNVTLDIESVIFLIDRNEIDLLFDVISARDRYLRFKKSFEKRQKLQEKIFMSDIIDAFSKEYGVLKHFSSFLLDELPLLINITRDVLAEVDSYIKKMSII